MSASTTHANTSEGTSDLACSLCRDRKIRCDREKPQCSNCRRDAVDCEYIAPTKRVNHTKLLCTTVNNVDATVNSMERRLIGLETQMHAIAALCSVGRAPIAVMVQEPITPASEGVCFPPDPDQPLLNRHLRNNSYAFGESYHGPGSLVDLCQDFRSSLPSDFSAGFSGWNSSDSPRANARHRSEVIQKLLDDAITEDETRLEIATGQSPPAELICSLPPKSVVLAATAQYFRQLDYVTDIFHEDSFIANLERVYADEHTDIVWAICFRAIVLLVCATELANNGDKSLLGGFARPYLTSGLAVAAQHHLGMSTRLANVQALILLSVCAQQFDPPGWSELLFGQACLLSRLMGLHQLQTGPSGVAASQIEMQERCKVLRSLYLQDKRLALRHGCASWLPEYDCNFPSSLDSGGLQSARLRLASIQDRLYRLVHAAGTRRQSSGWVQANLAAIDEHLESLYTSLRFIEPECIDKGFLLDILAARICANSHFGRPNAVHSGTVEDDATASCIVLLAGCGQQKTSMEEILGNILPGPTRSGHSGRETFKGQSAFDQPQPLLIHSLLMSFPLQAFFTLAKRTVNSPEPDQATQSNATIDLLQRVASCYKNYTSIFESTNTSSRIGMCFTKILEVIAMIKGASDIGDHSMELGRQEIQGDTPMAQSSENDADYSAFDMQDSVPWATPNSTSWDTNFMNDFYMDAIVPFPDPTGGAPSPFKSTFT